MEEEHRQIYKTRNYHRAVRSFELSGGLAIIEGGFKADVFADLSSKREPDPEKQTPVAVLELQTPDTMTGSSEFY